MQSHFLIITGMSGAGKTQVVRTLADTLLAISK